MTKALKRIDISKLPEVRRLVEEVRTAQESRLLEADSEEVAVLTPAKPAKRRSGRARPVTRDDALFRLIGIGDSGIPGGISEKKYEYLARAYRDADQ